MKRTGICECGVKCDTFLDFIDHARQLHPNESVTWSHLPVTHTQYQLEDHHFNAAGKCECGAQIVIPKREE